MLEDPIDRHIQKKEIDFQQHMTHCKVTSFLWRSDPLGSQIIQSQSGSTLDLPSLCCLFPCWRHGDASTEQQEVKLARR